MLALQYLFHTKRTAPELHRRSLQLFCLHDKPLHFGIAWIQTRTLAEVPCRNTNLPVTIPVYLTNFQALSKFIPIPSVHLSQNLVWNAWITITIFCSVRFTKPATFLRALSKLTKEERSLELISTRRSRASI